MGRPWLCSPEVAAPGPCGLLYSQRGFHLRNDTTSRGGGAHPSPDDMKSLSGLLIGFLQPADG